MSSTPPLAKDKEPVRPRSMSLDAPRAADPAPLALPQSPAVPASNVVVPPNAQPPAPPPGSPPGPARPASPPLELKPAEDTPPRRPLVANGSDTHPPRAPEPTSEELTAAFVGTDADVLRDVLEQLRARGRPLPPALLKASQALRFDLPTETHLSQFDGKPVGGQLDDNSVLSDDDSFGSEELLSEEGRRDGKNGSNGGRPSQAAAPFTPPYPQRLDGEDRIGPDGVVRDVHHGHEAAWKQDVKNVTAAAEFLAKRLAAAGQRVSPLPSGITTLDVPRAAPKSSKLRKEAGSLGRTASYVRAADTPAAARLENTFRILAPAANILERVLLADEAVVLTAEDIAQALAAALNAINRVLIHGDISYAALRAAKINEDDPQLRDHVADAQRRLTAGDADGAMDARLRRLQDEAAQLRAAQVLQHSIAATSSNNSAGAGRRTAQNRSGYATSAAAVHLLQRPTAANYAVRSSNPAGTPLDAPVRGRGGRGRGRGADRGQSFAHSTSFSRGPSSGSSHPSRPMNGSRTSPGQGAARSGGRGATQ